MRKLAWEQPFVPSSQIDERFAKTLAERFLARLGILRGESEARSVEQADKKSSTQRRGAYYRHLTTAMNRYVAPFIVWEEVTDRESAILILQSGEGVEDPERHAVVVDMIQMTKKGKGGQITMPVVISFHAIARLIQRAAGTDFDCVLGEVRAIADLLCDYAFTGLEERLSRREVSFQTSLGSWRCIIDSEKELYVATTFVATRDQPAGEVVEQPARPEHLRKAMAEYGRRKGW